MSNDYNQIKRPYIARTVYYSRYCLELNLCGTRADKVVFGHGTKLNVDYSEYLNTLHLSLLIFNTVISNIDS